MNVSKMKRKVAAGKTPVVLLACGSFSPPTMMHLRIFEDAAAALQKQGMEAVLGVLSPVHAKYGKRSLVDMKHRLKMAWLATQDSEWITVSSYECDSDDYTRTAVSLEYHANEFAQVPIQIGDNEPCAGVVKTMLICGSDLLWSFSAVDQFAVPVWAPADQALLLERGIVCIARAGLDISHLLATEAVFRHADSCVHVVKPRAENTISSSAVRACLQSGESIKYLVPDSVLNYIAEHNLFV